MGGVWVEWSNHPEIDLDRATEIAGFPSCPAASMTRVDRDRRVDGGLVYGEDVPLVSFGPAERHVRFRPASPARPSIKHGWRDVRWYRLEAKVDRPKHKAGWRLVVAQHPYANGLVTFQSVFKPERLDNHTRRPNPLELEMEFADEERLYEWMDREPGADRDLWESKARLTAGVSRPDPSLPPGKVHRNFASGALFVLGTCEDPDLSMQSLLASTKAGTLRDATRRDRLHFWYPEAEISTADGELRLFPEVKDQAENILRLSASQALAGPHHQSSAEIAKWIGRPVVDKLDHIYCSHMNNLNRAADGNP